MEKTNNKEFNRKVELPGTYQSPRVSSESMDCSLPMTFDHLSLCLPPGTMIKTIGGNIPVEQIIVGDNLLTVNLENKELEVNEVSKSFLLREKEYLVEVKTEDNRILNLTPEHPVYVKNKGWVIAILLEEGDIVLTIE